MSAAPVTYSEHISCNILNVHNPLLILDQLFSYLAVAVKKLDTFRPEISLNWSSFFEALLNIHPLKGVQDS